MSAKAASASEATAAVFVAGSVGGVVGASPWQAARVALRSTAASREVRMAVLFG